MKKLLFVLILGILFITSYAGTPPPKFKGTGGSAIVNKSADSVGFVFGSDTLWFFNDSIGWHADSMLSRSTLDSLVKGVGRFAAGGVNIDTLMRNRGDTALGTSRYDLGAILTVDSIEGVTAVQATRFWAAQVYTATIYDQNDNGLIIGGDGNDSILIVGIPYHYNGLPGQAPADSQLMTKGYIDNAISSGTGAWTQNDGNDSLRLIQKNGTDTLIYFSADTTNDTIVMSSDYTMIIGEDGLTVSDSLLIDTILYIVSPGGTDTVFITNVFIDSVRNGDFGGSGSSDSAIIDFGSNVYKSSSAKAWSLKLGQALQHTTPTDSSGIDTFTVYVDTNAIALIIEDSLNEYLLTSTASSTYEVQLNNEAGLYSVLSDVSDFIQLSDSANGVADGVAQFVTSNGVFDYIVTTRQLITKTDLDSVVTGNTESGIAVTYQPSDSTLDFIVQNVVSSMIAQQTILPADIDSTVQNFVFDDAFKGTSAIADSVLITRRELDDSLDAVRSENAGLFQPIGHGDADSLKGVPIPNTPTTGDDQKSLTYFETGDSLGWLANSGMAASAFDDSIRGNTYLDSIVEAADNDTLTINNLTISGELGVTGDYWQLNYGNVLNLNYANAAYPAEPLLDLQSVDSSGADLDSAWNVHPSNLYNPKGLLWNKDKKKIMAYTPLENEADENPHLVWAEAGTDNWLPIYNGTDTLKNPIFEPSDFTASTHISDPDILFDFNEDLWMIFRVTYGSDSEVIKICMLDTTAGGVPQMTTPVSILASNGSYLSPSIIRDTNQTYAMFLVEPNTVGGLDSSRVLRYVNDGTKLDSTGGWTFQDTCVFPYANGVDRPWHIEVIPRGADELLALVVGDPTNDAASLADTTSLYLATSYDRGATWSYGSATPARLLSYEDDTSAYYGRIMYRASGTWVDDGSGGYLDMYVSAKGPFHSSTNWYIFHTKLFFNNANIAATITQVIDTTWQPQDTGFSATLATIADLNDSAITPLNTYFDSIHYVPLTIVAGNTAGKTDSFSLQGASFVGDTGMVLFWQNKTGGTANGEDTAMIGGYLDQPNGYSDSCKHFIVTYSTSQSTAAETVIDSNNIFVGTTVIGVTGTALDADLISTTDAAIIVDTFSVGKVGFTRGKMVWWKLNALIDPGEWIRIYDARIGIMRD